MSGPFIEKKEEVAICAKCVHVVIEGGITAPPWWTCDAKVIGKGIDYQTGEEKTTYEYCERINTDGKCPDYEAKEESEVAG